MPVDAPDDPERDLEVGDTLERSKSGFCRAEGQTRWEWGAIELKAGYRQSGAGWFSLLLFLVFIELAM